MRLRYEILSSENRATSITSDKVSGVRIFISVAMTLIFISLIILIMNIYSGKKGDIFGMRNSMI